MVSSKNEHRGDVGSLSDAALTRIASMRAKRRASEAALRDLTDRARQPRVPVDACFSPDIAIKRETLRGEAAAELAAAVGLLAFLIAIAALYIIAPLPAVPAV